MESCPRTRRCTVQIVDNIIKGTGLTGGAGIRSGDTPTRGQQGRRPTSSDLRQHNPQLPLRHLWADEDVVSIVNNLVENVGQPGICVA
jgi:hypothetical protein